ncbi:MAG: hypothetical protein K8U57_38540 [Planctomycetes bacterium]|nr:hypothetical protein [Planctomycetota bacterium]
MNYEIDEGAERDAMARAFMKRLDERTGDTMLADFESMRDEDKEDRESFLAAIAAARSASDAHRLLPQAVTKLEYLRERVREVDAKETAFRVALTGLTQLIESFVLDEIIGQPQFPKDFLNALGGVQSLLADAVECSPEFVARIISAEQTVSRQSAGDDA